MTDQESWEYHRLMVLGKLDEFKEEINNLNKKIDSTMDKLLELQRESTTSFKNDNKDVCDELARLTLKVGEIKGAAALVSSLIAAAVSSSILWICNHFGIFKE